MSPEEESKENIVIKLSGQIEKLQKQAAELGKALPSSVEPYLGRAAELLLYGKNEKGFDDEAAVGISDLDERFMLAKCSLQCAVRSCTESSKKLKPSAGAAQAARLMMFTEAIHDMIDRIDQKASEGKELQIPPKNNSTSNDLNSKELAAERVALHLAAEEQLRQSEKRVIVDGAPVHGSSFEQDSSGGLYAFGQFCGNTRCANIVSDCNAGGICGTRTKLDEAILPRGAKAATVAATNNALTRGSRSLLESTAKALLSAAETAASTKKRQVAARQFQRAALHLEMLRLLSDEQLPPPLETSRRYARWRARHLSPLGENAVVEHGPERRFEDVYEAYLETKNQEKKKKVLGRGGYGVVFICTRKADGCKFACKQLDLSRLSPVGLAQLHEEVGCMRALDHPHIVKLIEVFYSQRKRCHLVMELCKGGELFSVLDEKCAAAGRPVQVFSEGRIAQVTRQMLGALRYMHNCGITHRDLKLENWLFDENDPEGSAHVKLVDFGLARLFGRDYNVLNDTPSGRFQDRVGSAYYVAPEVLNGEYDARCDLWSMGVIVYMLFCGAPPFWGSSDKDIMRRVKSHNLSFPDELFHGVSDCAKNFIIGLLDRNVNRRLTAAQALEHEFLTRDYALFFPLTSTALNDAAQYLGLTAPMRSQQMEIEDSDSLTISGASLSSRRSSANGTVDGDLATLPQDSEENIVDTLRRFAKLNALEKVVVELAASLMEPDRLVALRDDFLNADTNSDGKLTFTELKEYIARESKHSEESLQNALSSEELEALFDAVDVNKTRAISYREFVAAALYRRVDLDDKSLHAAFAAIDSEGLGYISREAVVATVGASDLGNSATADIQAALEEADTSGDGRVDIGEFLDYFKSARLRALRLQEEEEKQRLLLSSSPPPLSARNPSLAAVRMDTSP
eukprot:CAMPEP_0197294366 /NCGR_PEP_ID=MMETSP0890-20130614/32193_1 /TAXON_ID=44058 ORGANISM="Aureoumbra lagunensis, Strain CCMP1510" /NCGR_SAMPLE_ID=MMETSP0890 /ASSEMBLY_ACC=CAM_ASM_000533 /LENGTH=911 /DNA_ID=CAMNT_0042769739 /DNA_START=31 /DNA_END=2766 /DNA_ORIENTATION=-